MATRLYVGNLPYSMLDPDLAALFAQAGTVVHCELVLDRVTSRSKGFAFVEMSSQEESDKAVEMFNDYEVDGRRLAVNEARPREARGGRGGARGAPRGGGGGYSGGGGGGGGGFGFGGGGGGGGGGSSAFGAKRKSGKGSRRGARQAKRDRKGSW